MATVKRTYNHGGRISSRRCNAQPCLKQTLPLWEKEFCSKVGLFSWKKFLEVKKYINIYPRVMAWNDVAGEEAFKMAKKRFKSHYLGLPCNIPLPSTPDDCIDVVDWDSEIDPHLLEGMVSLDELEQLNPVDENENIDNAGTRVVVDIPIEAIKPTGWEVDVEEEPEDRLVGMIVGDDHWSNVVDGRCIGKATPTDQAYRGLIDEERVMSTANGRL